jgi:hypothetical protein
MEKEQQMPVACPSNISVTVDERASPDALFATVEGTIAMLVSLGLLIIRIVVGLLLMRHGAQKLFGWFGGSGFAGTMRSFSSMGFKPAWLRTVPSSCVPQLSASVSSPV